MNENIKDPNQLDLFEGVLLTPEQEKMVAEYIEKAKVNSLKTKEQMVRLKTELLAAGFVEGEDFIDTFEIKEVTQTVRLGYSYYNNVFETEVTCMRVDGDIFLQTLYINTLDKNNPQLVKSKGYLSAEVTRGNLKVQCHSVQGNSRFIKASTLLEKLNIYNSRKQREYLDLIEKNKVETYTIKKYQDKYPTATVTKNSEYDRWSGTYLSLKVEFPSGSFVKFRLYSYRKKDSEVEMERFDAEFVKPTAEEILDIFSNQVKKEASN